MEEQCLENKMLLYHNEFYLQVLIIIIIKIIIIIIYYYYYFYLVISFEIPNWWVKKRNSCTYFFSFLALQKFAVMHVSICPS